MDCSLCTAGGIGCIREEYYRYEEKSQGSRDKHGDGPDKVMWEDVLLSVRDIHGRGRNRARERREPSKIGELKNTVFVLLRSAG